ncbi:MAG: CotH kinase family protein [Melioribacteraceae bacterium]|nr:CotH kinase family protein [Melioribacteraceae bacterium]
MKKFCLILLFFSIKLFGQVTLTSSTLPIIIIDTNGQTIPDEPKITANLKIIDKGNGQRNFVNDPPNVYDGKIGIEIRGHSSQMFPKKQYGIELRDNAGNDIDVSILGFPAESDFVLNATYTDKSLLRNVIAYKLGNDLGRYATRTKFFELIINNDYKGIYILQEKIKRDKNRVNIKKIEIADTTGDALTGGYILKIDRIDPGDKYFNSQYPSVFPNTPSKPSPISYIIEYPKAEDIQPAQYNYIKNFINDFETSLTKSTYNDPFEGYYNFIDIDAWVDYFLVSEFTKATDAYRLSAFLHKDRNSINSKLIFGPLWDYDLSFGLADYGDGWKESGWVAQNNTYEGLWSPPFWIKKIFNDPVFFNKLARRWHTLKQQSNPFNPETIVRFIDANNILIAEAVNRNFSRWPELFNPNAYIWPNKNRFTNYNDELLYLKSWIAKRFDWINSNLPSDYSYVEWKQPGKRWLIYQIGKTVKLPLSIFYGEVKNVSSLQFVSKDPNANFSVLGDSLIISASKLGEFTFKGVVKKNNVVVSISPEYKINLATNIETESKLPTKFELFQNYPNPANPETNIKYTIPGLSDNLFVSLKIYDPLGNEIETLVNEYQKGGTYNYSFNTLKHKLSSGVYFYRLQAGNYVDTKKLMILK